MKIAPILVVLMTILVLGCVQQEAKEEQKIKLVEEGF